MTEVLQANVFFFITAMAVVVFTIFVCVAVYYVIGILRSVRNIAKRVEAGSETVAEDVRNLREYIAHGSLISQVLGMFMNAKHKKSRKKE